jgi:hypothetical protein
MSCSLLIGDRYKDSLAGRDSEKALPFLIPGSLLPQSCYLLAVREGKSSEVAVPIAFNRRSSFGMMCVRCSNELIAPEWSEYWNERRIRHHWRCSKCDCRFETIADTKSIKAI